MISNGDLPPGQFAKWQGVYLSFALACFAVGIGGAIFTCPSMTRGLQQSQRGESAIVLPGGAAEPPGAALAATSTTFPLPAATSDASSSSTSQVAQAVVASTPATSSTTLPPLATSTIKDAANAAVNSAVPAGKETEAEDWLDKEVLGWDPTFSEALGRCAAAKTPQHRRRSLTPRRSRRLRSRVELLDKSPHSAGLGAWKWNASHDGLEGRRLNADDLEHARSCVTSWRCEAAHGSQAWKPGENHGRRSACIFTNLFWHTSGRWEAYIVRGVSPSVDELRQMFIAFGPEMSMDLTMHEYPDLQSFATSLPSTAKEHGDLVLAFAPVWHFNLGHALFDGLYPAFVSLVQFGLQDRPFHAFVRGGHSSDVERQVPGAYDRMEKMMGDIAGLGLLTDGVLAEKPGLHKFKELVAGVGTNAAKMDMNVNYTLGGCRALDACRAFRRHVYKSLGLPHPTPARQTGKYRVIVIENKRYAELEGLAQKLQAEAAAGGALENFDIRFVSWSPHRKDESESTQKGNFKDHMQIISDTDVHVSGPGTGMMYQTFLPDGAVHINLGDSPGTWRNTLGKGFMEEYMAEGAPYLRALYYPKADLETSHLVRMLLQAGRLLAGGFSQDTPIGANLSPVGKVFKAYCYWAHKETFGIEALAKGLLPLRFHGGEHWAGFSEAFVYQGLPWIPEGIMKPDPCFLKYLRASFDLRYPEMNPGGAGWYETHGKPLGAG